MVKLTVVCRSDRRAGREGRAGERKAARRRGVGMATALLAAVVAGGGCAGSGDEAYRRPPDADRLPADTGAAGAHVADPGDAGIASDTAREPTGRWLFLVFERRIVEADLAWLEENGFRVDTVLGPTTLRGRLSGPDTDAGKIASDPRIESVEPLMP